MRNFLPQRAVGNFSGMGSLREHTDYAVLRAHFRDRLGIPALRGVPMVSSGPMGKCLRTNINKFMFVLQGFPFSPYAIYPHAHALHQIVKAVKSLCLAEAGPVPKIICLRPSAVKLFFAVS